MRGGTGGDETDGSLIGAGKTCGGGETGGSLIGAGKTCGGGDIRGGGKLLGGDGGGKLLGGDGFSSLGQKLIGTPG